MTRSVPVMLIGVLAASCGGSGSRPAAPTAPAPVAEAPEATESEVAPAAVPADEAVPSPPSDVAAAGPDLLAIERQAFEQAKPVFDTYCAKCHSKGSTKAKAKTLAHFDMTTYPFAGHHAHEVASEVRKVLGIGGGKPTMPLEKPGAVKGDELALVAAWADAFDKAHAQGKGHGDDDQGTHKH